jgi:hypothetical protein
MARTRKSPAEIVPALLIDLHAVYRAATIQLALGLGSRALRAEWRAGRLRIVRRCNRNFILGKDLLAWLDKGELPAPNRNGAAHQ